MTIYKASQTHLPLKIFILLPLDFQIERKILNFIDAFFYFLIYFFINKQINK